MSTILVTKKEETIAVYLTPREIELFKQFREHQNDFMLLKVNGIFNMKNGNICIHFDSNGMVRKIESNQVLFNT